MKAGPIEFILPSAYLYLFTYEPFITALIRFSQRLWKQLGGVTQPRRSRVAFGGKDSRWHTMRLAFQLMRRERRRHSLQSASTPKKLTSAGRMEAAEQSLAVSSRGLKAAPSYGSAFV